MNPLTSTTTAIKQRSEHLFRNVRSLTEWIREFKPFIRMGIPWSLENHAYMKEIVSAIDVFCQNIVVRKAAQVGVSTAFLMESFYLAEVYAAKSLYYFPNDKAIIDFSQDRADKMILATKHLTDVANGVQNVHFKSIGAGAVYFRGLFSKIKVKSVDGDVLYLDELDESNCENTVFARDRLLHSSMGFERAFSQPSFPDFGIDQEFKKGSQEHFFLKCPHCGLFQCLELNLEDGRFPKNFMRIPKAWKGGRFPQDQTWYRGCLKCKEKLDVNLGQTVASFPNTRIRSFHLSQLYAHQMKRSYYIEDSLMDKLLAANTSTKIKNAVISIIGFPYVDSNLQPINDTVLDKATGDRSLAMVSDQSFMGVDQGDILSIVIGDPHFNKLQTVYLEQTGDWSRLYKLMDQFNVQHCVIDAMPNKSDAKRFAASFPGRVTIQYFKSTLKKSEEPFIDEAIASSIPVIQVDRTESLDDTVYEIANGGIILPRNDSLLVEDLRRHLKNLYREKNEDTGEITYKKLVENHYGMALNSCRLAMLHCPRPIFIGLPPMSGKGSR